MEVFAKSSWAANRRAVGGASLVHFFRVAIIHEWHRLRAGMAAVCPFTACHSVTLGLQSWLFCSTALCASCWKRVLQAASNSGDRKQNDTAS